MPEVMVMHRLEYSKHVVQVTVFPVFLKKLFFGTSTVVSTI